MNRPRYTSEEIRSLLRRADEAMGLGQTQREVCKALGISPSSYRRWSQQSAPTECQESRPPSRSAGGARQKAEALAKPLVDGFRGTLQKRGPMFFAAAREGLSVGSEIALGWAAELPQKASLLIESLASQVPTTTETRSLEPAKRSQAIIQAAARKAAVISGGLALPGGPLALVTVLPDLITIWKIQRQMVADIAGSFGQAGALTREHMFYCLFKHAASQVLRDFAVRVGDRALVRRGSTALLRRAIGKLTLPFLGAAAVAGYAYFDTVQVGKTAIGIFAEKG